MIHTLDSDIEYYGKMKDLEKEAGEDFSVHTELIL